MTSAATRRKDCNALITRFSLSMANKEKENESTPTNNKKALLIMINSVSVVLD